jgi:hypothetical protein
VEVLLDLIAKGEEARRQLLGWANDPVDGELTAMTPISIA